MRTLKTRQRYLAVIYNFFKSIPPSKIATLDDMEIIQEEIKPVILRVIGNITEVQDNIDTVQKRFAKGKVKIRALELSKKETAEKNEELRKSVQDELDELSLKMEEYNKNDKEIEIDLENKPFNLFFDLVTEHLKTLFRTIEDTVAFKNDLAAANSQPKNKGKK